MLGNSVKTMLLIGLVFGLCAPMHANTTMAEAAQQEPVVVESDANVERIHLALLLPKASSILGSAAEAVLKGFQAAHDQKASDNHVDIHVIETGESAQEMYDAYRLAVGSYNIIVGPLSRNAVATMVKEGNVTTPTIALAQPELLNDLQPTLPANMLAVGLSIEDEARQVAIWVASDKPEGHVFVVSTQVGWQQRAAKAFSVKAQEIGIETVSLVLSNKTNELATAELKQLQQRIQSEKPASMFVALDAGQTVQLRAVIGTRLPLYGTSQLNPMPRIRAESNTVNRLPALNGVKLIEIPWQLPDAYLGPETDILAKDVEHDKPSADLARLYALGIDAYHIADEIMQKHPSFYIDGATGRLSGSMVDGITYFQRQEIPAIYQDGVVVPFLH